MPTIFSNENKFIDHERGPRETNLMNNTIKPRVLWAQQLAIDILAMQLRSAQQGVAEQRLSTMLLKAVEARLPEEIEAEITRRADENEKEVQ